MKKIILLFLMSVFVCPLVAQQWKKQFGGAIKTSKEDLDIELRIEQKGDSLFGSYYYTSIGKDMQLKGMLSNGKINLKEYNAKDVHTGTFSGTYYTKGDSMKGTWTNAKKSTSLAFNLYSEDPTDYKLIHKKTTGDNTEMEWFEMRENPDTQIQNTFNTLEENTPRSFNNIEASYFVDGVDTIYYFMTTWRSLELKTNDMICFSRFNSDYWGGMGADNSIVYYLFDLKEGRMLDLNEILRDDTNSLSILEKWVNEVIKKRGDWDMWKSDYLEYFKKESFLEQFYLRPDGIYFFFPAYGASTNILWMDDVKISYKSFIKIVDRNSIVYKWMIETGKGK